MKKALLALGLVVVLGACSSTKPTETVIVEEIQTETVIVEQPETAPVVKKVIMDK